MVSLEFYVEAYSKRSLIKIIDFVIGNICKRIGLSYNI